MLQIEQTATAQPTVPPQNQALAEDILRLQELSFDPKEFRAAEIRGFQPIAQAMKDTLVDHTLRPSLDTRRALPRLVLLARRYILANFAPAHDMLHLSYRMIETACEITGADPQAERDAFRRGLTAEERRLLEAPARDA